MVIHFYVGVGAVKLSTKRVHGKFDRKAKCWHRVLTLFDVFVGGLVATLSLENRRS